MRNSYFDIEFVKDKRGRVWRESYYELVFYESKILWQLTYW